MGLFDRLRRPDRSDDGRGVPGGLDDGPDEPLDDNLPLRTRTATLPAEDRARVDATLSDLAAQGVDVGDLDSIGSALDGALTDWLAVSAKTRPDPAPLIERYAVAIGEYLTRHTDLEWLLVTDAFGTSPGVACRADDFAVVPKDLVGVRWLSRRTGWVRDVVEHLVWVRRDRTGRAARRARDP